MIKKKTHTFESFDGTKIYAEIRGEGEPLIFVYGLACLMNHWKYQISYFSKTHKVITFDLRGHHNSGTPENRDFSVESTAKDLLHLCEELSIKKAHFIGHSFGSQLLIESFNKKPELFDHLVLFNGFSDNPFSHLASKESLIDFLEKVEVLARSYPKPTKKVWQWGVKNPLAMYISYLTGGFTLTSIKDIEIYARGVANIRPENFVTMFKSLFDYKGSTYLEKIDIPTLLIGGKKDSITPLRLQQSMAKKIKSSQLVVVPHGSHCTQLDFPDYSNLLIEKFIQS